MITSENSQNTGSFLSMVEARRVQTAETRGAVAPERGIQDQRSQS